MLERAQGAFEYVMLLGGVLLVVVLSVVILRQVMPSGQQQIEANVQTIERLNCLPTFLTDGASVVGWWKLDEGSGTFAGDSSGKGNHGSLSDAGGWTAQGVLGAAFDFQSRTLTIPDSSSLDINGDLTIEVWVRRASGSGYLLRKIGAYELILFNTQPRFSIGGGAQARGGNVGTKAWAHVTAVYRQADDDAYIFVNGVQTAYSGTGSILQNNADVIASSTGDHRYDNIIVYSRALSPEEIRRDYECASNAYA